MIYIKVPEEFRGGDFSELLELLQSLTEPGLKIVKHGKTCVVDEIIGAGWKLCYTRFDIRDSYEWFIKFEQESLATLFALKWPQ